uniref:Dynein light chain n=1 Tax=Panagrolaimus sp. JU765 TaxID=591449 RepID=A0AC34PUI9_9BILA
MSDPVAKYYEPTVKSTDMSESLQAEVFQVANEALSKFKIEKDVAVFIKEEFDKRHGSSWHCVVGRNFGSFVSHETNTFIYFYLNHVAIMLYKTAF